MLRKISQDGIDLIKSFEGFKPDAYLCPAGKWTVGYGTTFAVNSTAHVSFEEAEEYLRRDISKIEDVLNSRSSWNLTQNQFDALCSFVYNIGLTSFRCSHLYTGLNSGHKVEAADEFLRWRFIHTVENSGLLTRRQKERKLFLEPDM